MLNAIGTRAIGMDLATLRRRDDFVPFCARADARVFDDVAFPLREELDMAEPEGEPTTGLDPLTSRKVDRLIIDMRDRFLVTSIVITHDMATAYEIADRVMLLEHGKFVAEASTEEFFASDLPAVRTFADSSGFEPKKLAATRVGRKTSAEIRAAWTARMHP